MTTKPIRLRHERKHQISLPEDLVLAGRLRKLFVHDPYAGADGVYRVTSLYFDTPYDAALREKLDGVGPPGKVPPALLRNGHVVSAPGEEDQGGRPVRKAQRPPHAGRGRAAAGRGVRFPAEKGGAPPDRAVQQAAGAMAWPRARWCATTGRRSSTLRAMSASHWTGRSAPGGARWIFSTRSAFRFRSWRGSPYWRSNTTRFLPDLVRMAVQVPDRQAGACSKYALCRRFD